MKILIVGSGGREHALAWKLSQSPKISELFCAPGNAGTAELVLPEGNPAKNISIEPTDTDALLEFALSNKINLTVVGPETPLVEGIVDKFEAKALKIFGPSQAAAQLEGSKVFAKNLMLKNRIPTAEAIPYEKAEDAFRFVKKIGTPIVIKADGLAAGKGVVVAKTIEEAKNAIDRMLVSKEFGAAGKKILIEEYLKGPEVSILALTDGESILPLATSQDHKRVFDDDRGPNTGGMGAYSPVPMVTEELYKVIEEKILKKTISALKENGIAYKGVLYCGLVLTDRGPMVLEYNCRFGDPETQAILPRMKSDLLEFLLDAVETKLSGKSIVWDERSAVCVVLASGGYPDKYEKDIEITGLEKTRSITDAVILHAGTKISNQKILTAGGRVLGVVGLGHPLKNAIDKAYSTIKLINFNKMHYRKDIGAKALK